MTVAVEGCSGLLELEGIVIDSRTPRLLDHTHQNVPGSALLLHLLPEYNTSEDQALAVEIDHLADHLDHNCHRQVVRS
jgi:hypothetical protein